MWQREPARIIGHAVSLILIPVLVLLEGGWPGWSAIVSVIMSGAVELIRWFVTPVADPRDGDGNPLFPIRG